MPFFTFIYYCFVIWVMFSILTFPRMQIEKKLILCFFTYAFPGLGPLIGYHFLKRHRDREIRRILREREAYRRRSRYAEPPRRVRNVPVRGQEPVRERKRRRPTPVAKQPVRDPDNLDVRKDTEALDGLLEDGVQDEATQYEFRELKEKHDVLRELEHESVEISGSRKVLGTIALIVVVALQVGVLWWAATKYFA